jgi:hypothetical protein
MGQGSTGQTTAFGFKVPRGVYSYLAGLVDADGSIGLRIEKRGSLSLRLTVYNTNETVMDWLKIHYSGNIYRSERSNPKHKPQFQWSVNGSYAEVILRAIEPYMIIKQARERLGIEAWNSRQPTPLVDRRQPVLVDVLAMRQEYVDKMNEQNRTGVLVNG